MPPMTPATNVPWNDCDSSSGCLDSEVETSGKKALATITFGVVKPGVPLGKPAGKLRPPGSRNGCFGSMPSSTTPTLTPWPPMPVAARSAGRADHRGTAVQRQRVAGARVDVLDEPHPHQPLQLRRGQLHGEPVEQDPEAPRHLRLGDLPAQRGHGSLLRGGKPGEIRARGRAGDAELAPARGREERPIVGPGCERRHAERRDHGHPARVGAGGNGYLAVAKRVEREAADARGDRPQRGRRRARHDEREEKS